MKKILVFGFTDNIGGIETFFMTYYRKLKSKTLQFDFVTIYDKMAFEEELLNDNCKVFKLPNFKKHPFKYKKILKDIIKKEKYDVVHVNMLSAANILPIEVAYKCGVKKIIAHSHNAGIPKGNFRKILHRINKKKIEKYSNNFLACSELAGKWLFGENQFDVINNALDLDKFKYNEEIRKRIRKELNIDNKFVIGHVGRFSEQKNHLYLVEILEECLKEESNICLLLIGEGTLEENIKNIIKDKKIEDKVIFLGARLDTHMLYNAFDCFVLPSLFEGLPVVGLEAQANGLNCIFSSTITREVQCNTNVSFIDINEECIQRWKEKILEIRCNCQRYTNQNRLDEKYNINKEKIKIKNLYK